MRSLRRRYINNKCQIIRIFIPSLNNGLGADIDEKVCDIVNLMNNIPNVITVSSCQGDPGEISLGGKYGHIAFIVGDGRQFKPICDLCFSVLPSLVEDIWDDVRLEVSYSPERFTGWMRFRHEAIATIEKRLRVMIDQALMFANQV